MVEGGAVRAQRDIAVHAGRDVAVVRRRECTLCGDAHVEDIERVLGALDQLAEVLVGLAVGAHAVRDSGDGVVAVVVRTAGEGELREERTRGEKADEGAAALE